MIPVAIRSRLRSLTIEQILWSLLLISVPFTSFPLVQALARGSTVNPLSAVPLALLMVFWFPRYLLNGGQIPRLAIPLLGFVAIAVLASALSLLLDIRPALGVSQLNRISRGLLTLAVGTGFYLIASTLPQSATRLNSSLISLYIGAALMLIWSSVQIWFVASAIEDVPHQVQAIHRVLSQRDLTVTRVTGFAYEPSWLANQIVILYVPLWLGSVIQGYSAFSSGKSRASVELLFLLWSLAVLFFTLSRIGFISILAIGVVLAIGIGRKVAKRWSMLSVRAERISDKEESEPGLRPMPVLFVAVLILLTLIAGGVMLYLGARMDARIAKLFDFEIAGIFVAGSDPIYQIAYRLGFAERLTYWASALRVFSAHPILGAGIGNTGFFFIEMVPSFGYGQPEIIRILAGEADFPNPKNLWIRLLAETGIVGFLVFVMWLGLTAKAAWTLHKYGQNLRRAIGTAGLLALLVQIFEGFNIDTFALPQMWIMFGLVSAAYSWQGETPGEGE